MGITIICRGCGAKKRRGKINIVQQGVAGSSGIMKQLLCQSCELKFLRTERECLQERVRALEAVAYAGAYDLGVGVSEVIEMDKESFRRFEFEKFKRQQPGYALRKLWWEADAKSEQARIAEEEE